MTTIPLYPKPCLVPSAGNSVHLVGIASSREGTLEANTIDLTNINTPTIKQFAAQVNPLAWSSSQALACHPFAGLASSNNNGLSPFVVAQFGAFKTFFSNINPAGGTIEQPIRFDQVAFTSPRNFAMTGAAGGSDWVLSLTNTTVVGSGSYWSGIRFNGTSAIASNYNFGMSVVLTSNPLLTVGTYSVDPTAGLGYAVVFDFVGGGTAYTATGTMSDIKTPDQRIINLTNSRPVIMSGIVLTANAIPITSGETAYILDQGSDGSTVVYYLNPSTSTQLTPLLIKGQVPKFGGVLTATALNTQIVIYSSGNGASPTFNILDTTTGTWTGPGLMAPSLPSTSGASLPSPSNGTGGGGESKSNLPGIIGGVVGGLVVVALVAFLFIRNRRRKNTVPAVQKPVETSFQDPSQHGSPTQMMQQSYPQQQQQQQQLYQQQYQQQQSVGSPANSHSHTASSTGADYPTSPTSTTPMTSHMNLHSSALNLEELQELYKPPPSNPQYVPGASDK
ncbi:hypothetical protein EC991_002758 [Linnemannia zychae]|nr:hypothetical protein EC991_002758 [Linnemannia zychae]